MLQGGQLHPKQMKLPLLFDNYNLANDNFIMRFSKRFRCLDEQRLTINFGRTKFHAFIFFPR